MRILVADDERDLNALIAQKLRKEHYSVDCCHDGEEALEYLRMADYDAVVLDIMMPKKDGISVLKELRANGSHVQVLLLTARTDEEVLDEEEIIYKTVFRLFRYPMLAHPPASDQQS